MFNKKPSEDVILSSNCAIFIKQMDLIWGMMKHVSYVGGGTLLAWYYLLSDDPLFSALLILLSSAMMFVFIIIIRRQSYLQIQYGSKILPTLKPGNRPNEGMLNRSTFNKSLFEKNLTAIYLARLIPTMLLVNNFVLLIISGVRIIDSHALLGFFILYLCFSIFIVFAFNLEEFSNKLLYD